MKTLLILRHAKSSWKEAGLPDHERPLNPRGERDAPRVGKRLREEALLPDVILSSTAVRARQTAEAVAEESGFEGEIRLSGELYGGGPEAYLEALRSLPEQVACALVVGHNPDVEELVGILSEESVRMPTAALAHLQLNIQRWQGINEEVQGKLVDVWRPREDPSS